MNKEHLEHRKVIKKKKPNFVRQDAALPKLEKVWRRPKGLDSKRRLKKDGHQKRPSRGYSSPKSVRGLNNEGLREVMINSVKDLMLIVEGTVGVVGRTVGGRKKLEITKAAKEQKKNLSNIDADKFIKSQEEKAKEKQAKKKETAEKKKQKEEAAKKEEKKETSQEEKEKKMKEEKKKVLTGKEAQHQ